MPTYEISVVSHPWQGQDETWGEATRTWDSPKPGWFPLSMEAAVSAFAENLYSEGMQQIASDILLAIDNAADILAMLTASADVVGPSVSELFQQPGPSYPLQATDVHSGPVVMNEPHAIASLRAAATIPVSVSVDATMTAAFRAIAYLYLHEGEDDGYEIKTFRPFRSRFAKQRKV